MREQSAECASAALCCSGYCLRRHRRSRRRLVSDYVDNLERSALVRKLPKPEATWPGARHSLVQRMSDPIADIPAPRQSAVDTPGPAATAVAGSESMSAAADR